jgi:hypothetical protein
MVGRIPIQAIDRGSRHELLDVDDACRFELHRVQLVLVEQHVFAFGDLKALYKVAAGDFLARARIEGLHADTVVGLGVDQVESDGLGLGRGRPQRDRTGNERQAQMPLPRRTCSHVFPLHWRGLNTTKSLSLQHYLRV